MELQADITQRQPLLSQSEEELEFQGDSEESLEYHNEKYTVREKLLAFACGWLLLGMCLFAFLYHRRGGGHQHGSAMDISQFDQSVCSSDQCIVTAAQMIQYMNTTVDPCSDFYAYTCGGSVNNHASSEDQRVLDYVTRNILNPNIRQLNVSAEDQKGFDKLDQFYESCLHRNSSNLTSLNSMLNRLDNIFTTVNSDQKRTILSEALGYLASNNIFPFFQLQVTQDLKNVTTFSLDILQAGMTLPTALDYHSSATVDAFKFNIRSTLQVLATYRVDMFQGVDVDQWANEITSLEMKLAVINESPDQLYASTVSKTLYSIHELDALIPSLDWAKYFGLATKNSEQVLYVRTPEYLKGLQDLLAVESSRTLHAYIVWHTLLSNANEMPMEARNAIGAINRDLVYDEDEHCARKVNSVFGSLIGDYFPVVDQERIEVMQQLFIDIKRTLARMLPKFGWIDRMTSGHAIRKLEIMTMEIGHPPHFVHDPQIQLNVSSHVSYDKLQITQDYVRNVINARRWKYESTLALLDRKTNETVWPILPQGVQMYYHANENKLIVPAGSLFSYYASQPDYLTYGQLGVQLAEQMIRACDAVGSHFDIHGQINAWWSEITREAYSARRQCLVSETNDTQTLDEILRQQAGMQIAYRAWAQRLQNEPKARLEAIPGSVQGLGPEKAFYIAHGLLQCQSSRLWLNEAVRQDRGFLRIYQCNYRNEVKSCSSMWS